MNAPSFLTLLAATAPQAAEPQILDIDGTVLVMLGLFVLLVFVLTPLFWKPYLRVRAERGSRVEGYREEALRMEADAAARLAKCDQQLAEVRRQGASAFATARAEAQAREQTLMAQAHAAARGTLADASRALDETLAVQRAQLAARARELGRQAAERVLGRPVAS